MLMNRRQFGTHQPSYPSHGEQNREIGLRAVAAAIRYQGNTHNMERILPREPPTSAKSATQAGDPQP